MEIGELSSLPLEGRVPNGVTPKLVVGVDIIAGIFIVGVGNPGSTSATFR
jgi:hypothetical protein